MGYALFANRKIYYTSLKNQLQMKLDAVSQKRFDLMTYSANISDGDITFDEISGDLQNYGNYVRFWQEAEAYRATDDEYQTAYTETMGRAQDANYDDESLWQLEQSLIKSGNEAYAEKLSKKLEVEEAKLEAEQKKIESQLSVVDSQLQAVEQAEGDAITKSAPKFAGLGRG